MKDLQSIINERATKKLNSDVNDFLNTLKRNELWESIENEFYVVLKNEKMTLRELSWTSSSPIERKMKEKMLPKYIERESEEFMSKVEQFKEDYNKIFEE